MGRNKRIEDFRRKSSILLFEGFSQGVRHFFLHVRFCLSCIVRLSLPFPLCSLSYLPSLVFLSSILSPLLSLLLLAPPLLSLRQGIYVQLHRTFEVRRLVLVHDVVLRELVQH